MAAHQQIAKRDCWRLGLDEKPPDSTRGAVLTIGNFDGVHLGHASLVHQLIAQAKRTGGPAVVVSFDPHPLQILAPDQFMPVLTTVDERSRLLYELGVDAVVFLRTDRELLQLSPAEFFQQIVRRSFQAKAMVEGFNFRFGRDRAGDTDMLAAACCNAGMTFELVPPFSLDGLPVSSSRVRRALLTGDVNEAARLLNRRYRIRGRVGKGAMRGRTIGFPTANLEEVSVLLPGDGVYAVRVLANNQRFIGAANVGPNPTFGDDARKMEVHLLDFSGDLYGTEIEVEFVQRLRSTTRFRNADELIQQLHNDIAAVRQIAAEV